MPFQAFVRRRYALGPTADPGGGAAERGVCVWPPSKSVSGISENSEASGRYAGLAGESGSLRQSLLVFCLAPCS